MTQAIYGIVARLFEYPGEDYRVRASDCLELMSREQPGAARLLEDFYAAIQGLDTDELQEMFTRTFDLNPVCSLEIGWHLYGEDYKRGEFLVKMRQQLRAREIPESTELPDHLTHVLTLLGRMKRIEAAAFATQYVLPALDKMRGGWQTNRNPFASLLESVFVLLKTRYPYEPRRQATAVPELRVLQ